MQVNLGRVVPVNEGRWTAEKTYRLLSTVSIISGEYLEIYCCQVDECKGRIPGPENPGEWALVGRSKYKNDGVFIDFYKDFSKTNTEPEYFTEIDNQAFVYYYIGDPFYTSGPQSNALYNGGLEFPAGQTKREVKRKDLSTIKPLLGEKINAFTMNFSRAGQLKVEFRRGSGKIERFNVQVEPGENKIRFQDHGIDSLRWSDLTCYFSVSGDPGMFKLLAARGSDPVFGKQYGYTSTFVSVGEYASRPENGTDAAHSGLKLPGLSFIWEY